jgi:hypothetical protein
LQKMADQIVGRQSLSYPEFNKQGGYTLDNQNRAMMKTLSDNANSRAAFILGLGNGATTEVNHNLGSVLASLLVKLWTLTGQVDSVSDMRLTNSGTTGEADNTYAETQASGAISTDGSGTGLELDVVVASGAVLDTTSITNGGVGFQVNDTITIEEINSQAMTVDATFVVTNVTNDGAILTLISDTSNYVIAGKTGEETETVEVTNNTGGSVDIAITISQDPMDAANLQDFDDSVAPEDGQAWVWSDASSKYVLGASGDASFKLQSIVGQDLTVKSGFLILNDGRELRTASGNDLTVDLSGLADDTYYFYIDISTLGSPAVVSGRTVIDVANTDIVGLTTTPDEVDLARYIPLGGGTKSTSWSNLFSTAFRRHNRNINTGRPNWFINGDFERGLANWSSTKPAQIAIAEGGDQIEGDKSLEITSDGAGQVVSTELKKADDAYKDKLHAIEGTIDVPSTAAVGEWVARFKRDGTTIPGLEWDLSPGRNYLDGNTILPLLDTISFEIEDVSASNLDEVIADIFVVTPQGLGNAPSWPSYDETEVTLSPESGSFNFNYGRFIPYRDGLGNPWLYFTYTADLGSGPTDVDIDFTITGVTFLDTESLANWLVNWSSDASDVDNIIAYAVQNGNTITVESATSKSWNTRNYLSGHVPLKSWPTWATKNEGLKLLSSGSILQNTRARFYRNANVAYTNDTIVPFDTESTVIGKTQGISNSSGTLSVDKAGTYRITSNISSTTDFSSSGDGDISLYKNGSLLTKMGSEVGSPQTDGSVTVDLLPTDTFSIRVSSSFTIDGGDDSTWVEIVQVPDETGNQAIGAGTNEGVGEAPKYVLVRYSELTKALDNEFTGGSLKFVRIGNVVTVTATQAPLHASAANRSSSVGFIPVEYRPTTDVRVVTGRDATSSIVTQCQDDGTFRFDSYDDAGTVAITNYSGWIPCISYVIT